MHAAIEAVTAAQLAVAQGLVGHLEVPIQSPLVENPMCHHLKQHSVLAHAGRGHADAVTFHVYRSVTGATSCHLCHHLFPFFFAGSGHNATRALCTVRTFARRRLQEILYSLPGAWYRVALWL